jgi:hypothetical protein
VSIVSKDTLAVPDRELGIAVSHESGIVQLAEVAPAATFCVYELPPNAHTTLCVYALLKAVMFSVAEPPASTEPGGVPVLWRYSYVNVSSAPSTAR